jgi:hypothetical protein
MVYVSDADSWQRIFQVMSENSRWDLADAEVGRYLATSFDYVVDFLLRSERSLPYKLDPAGEEALRGAKLVRRAALRSGGPEAMLGQAEAHFGLPRPQLSFVTQLEVPLFPPATSDNS